MADGVSQLTIGCHYARSPNIQRFIFVCRDGISIDPSDRRMAQTCSSLFRRVLLLFFIFFIIFFFFVFILLLFFFMFVVSPLAAVSRSAASTAAVAAAAALHRNVIEIFAYAWQQRRHLNALFAGVFKPRFLSWSCTLKLEKICSHSTSPVLFDAIFWYFFQRQFRTWKIAKVARKIINAVIFRRHFPCCCYIFRIDENQLRCWRIFFTSGSCLLVFKTNIFAVKMF